MTATTDTRLAETLAYFATLREFAPSPEPRTDRDRFRTLLHRIGDPHESLRCLHVAGTNGKGSTTTFLASALKEAGYRVGAYLSPFVWDIRERWLIDSEMIPPGELVAQVDALRPHVAALAQTAHGQITEFELKTAVALRWFAQEQVDFTVLEVGIGGRLDSTNVIPPPLVSVITSIGFDHQALLGNTLAEIAGEKAGIIKRGSLACVTAADAEPRSVIRAKAREQDVPLIEIGDAETRETGTFDLLLRGDFQHKNAACALAALRVLRGADIIGADDATLRRGLKRATLPGRFEVDADSAHHAPVVRDVAHNADAARVLADALTKTFGTGKRAILVVGMSRGHDPLPFLAELAPLTKNIIACAATFRPKPVEEIAQAARQLNLPVRVTKNVGEALKEAQTEAVKANGDYVVVTGSFYTVGDSK